MEGAEEFQAEAERYRQDIRAAAERSIALSPVLPVSDGTYRRYMPPGVYMRKSMLGWHKEVTSGAMWLVGEDRIFGANEPIARELLDVVEEVLQAGDTQTTDWLSKGGTGSQTGWERHKALYLLCDDIPPFLRALYNGYAGDSQPWEAIRGQPSYRFQDGHLAAGAIAGRAAAYTFWEHPQGGAADKTHGEAVFLEYVRNMLVMEIGDALWLARATPRPWLEQGKKIAVKNAPTHFGTVNCEIVSDADHGKISATIEMPARKAPKEVVLRFRHPKAAPIKNVAVNGKPWTEFNQDKETITLMGLNGTVAVTAQY
jgi:hypothetical protein